MKLFKNIFLLLLIGLTVTSFAQEQTVPDISINKLDGESVNIKDYANNGKITVLSFWATWCKPCKLELDVINEIYGDWVEEYDVELVAITIDTRRALAKVPGLVSSKGWEFEVLSDANSQLPQAMGFQTIPQTYLLDQNGNIVYSHSGYASGDEEELEEEIAKLLE